MYKRISHKLYIVQITIVDKINAINIKNIFKYNNKY